MTVSKDAERAQELGRLWQGSVVPVEDGDVADARRRRMVPALSSAIEQASRNRRKERGLRRAVGVFAVAASLALAVGVGELSHRTGSTEDGAAARTAIGSVRALGGSVSLVRNARSRVVARSELEMGDALATTGAGHAEVRLSNLVVADVGAESLVAVVPPKASTHRLRLDRGTLEARVDDRPSPTPKLVVQTPNVDVVVTGTVFAVGVTEPGAGGEPVTTVSVEKGRIVVRRDGMDVAVVSAGEHWTSAAAESAARPPDRTASAEPPRQPEDKASSPARTPGSDGHHWTGTLAEENRLFQSAADARNRGNDREAADRLGELLAKYPRSPLAGEARVERMRALQRIGSRSEAAREAERYLAAFPDGFARAEAERLIMQDDSR